ADAEVHAIRRPLLAQLFDARAKRAAETDEIRAFLLKDDEAGRVFAVDPEGAVGTGRRHLDVRDVAKQHRARGIDTQLAERSDAFGPAVEHDLPAAAVPLGAAEVTQPLHRLTEQPRDHLGANAERRAALGIDPYRH